MPDAPRRDACGAITRFVLSRVKVTRARDQPRSQRRTPLLRRTRERQAARSHPPQTKPRADRDKDRDLKAREEEKQQRAGKHAASAGGGPTSSGANNHHYQHTNPPRPNRTKGPKQQGTPKRTGTHKGSTRTKQQSTEEDTVTAHVCPEPQPPPRKAQLSSPDPPEPQDSQPNQTTAHKTAPGKTTARRNKRKALNQPSSYS